MTKPEYKSVKTGLPHCFITPELHFVPDSQRQMPASIPASLRALKVYNTKDLETISSEYEYVKSLGIGTAEEWIKGLYDKGKEAMTDSARWEKWEVQVRPVSDLSQVLREYDLSSFPRYFAAAQVKKAAGPSASSSTMLSHPVVANGKLGHSHLFQHTSALPSSSSM